MERLTSNFKTLIESDLYPPIKHLLESQGFTVKGEVKGCDIAAVKDDTLWLIEIKKNFNVKLLYQAMSRLSVTPNVFVAIPRPKRIDNNFRLAQKILKKLEIGLIIVSKASAEIIFPPAGNKKNSKKATAFFEEIKGRTSDTPGGSTGTIIMSAYREECIKIACILEHHGVLPPKTLVNEHHCRKDTARILHSNFYGWFERIAHGQYALSPAGLGFLQDNRKNPLVIHYTHSL